MNILFLDKKIRNEFFAKFNIKEICLNFSDKIVWCRFIINLRLISKVTNFKKSKKII